MRIRERGVVVTESCPMRRTQPPESMSRVDHRDVQIDLTEVDVIVVDEAKQEDHRAAVKQRPTTAATSSD